VVEGVVGDMSDVGVDEHVGDYELLGHNKDLDGENDETITSFLCFRSRSYH
jgi:hypothetical protein